MKHFFLYVTVGWLTVSTVYAQLWTKTDFQDRMARAVSVVPPSYQTFQLDDTLQLRQLLQRVPDEAVLSDPRQSTTVVELPYPDGSLKRFRLVRYSVMEEGLQRKYPDILTFRGVGVDDLRLVVHVGWTPWDGLRVVGSGSGGDFMIDPVGSGDRDHYVVYFRKDTDEEKLFTCGVTEAGVAALPSTLRKSNEPCVTMKPRSFRLALSCTGEFAQAVTGMAVPDVSKVLGFMATAVVLRLNLIYERDLSVRLKLVDNTDKLIYQDPDKDPYTHNSIDKLMAEGQSTCRLTILSANYDLGHVLDWNSSQIGKSIIGGVCWDDDKARAATICDFTIGSSLGLVAHEIGHQLGANHSFNACFAERVAGSAYEPGSGSTIMSYAGFVCGPDTPIQSDRDLYFHAGSRAEILAVLMKDRCSTPISTENRPPQITSMGYVGSGVIPAKTPFVLEGKATDADGDVLSYCWEEMDLGWTAPWSKPSANSPLFRSRPPQSTGRRSFPDIRVILADYPENPTDEQLRGEVLTSDYRSLRFRMTVRDGQGGVAASSLDGCSYAEDIELNVNGSAGPFVVTSPTKRDTLTSATTQLVTWDVANTGPGTPVNCSTVKILLSIDGGYTYPYVLDRSTANDGMAWITLPLFTKAQTNCRFRVQAEDNVFFDISDENLTIKGTVPTYRIGAQEQVEVPSAAIIYPNPVGDRLWITLPKSVEGSSVEVEVSTVSGVVVLRHRWESGLRGSVDVSHLSMGLYVVRVTSGGVTTRSRVVKLAK